MRLEPCLELPLSKNKCLCRGRRGERQGIAVRVCDIRHTLTPRHVRRLPQHQGTVAAQLGNRGVNVIDVDEHLETRL